MQLTRACILRELGNEKQEEKKTHNTTHIANKYTHAQ